MPTMHGCSSCGQWCGEHDFLGNSSVVGVVGIAGGVMYLDISCPQSDVLWLQFYDDRKMSYLLWT